MERYGQNVNAEMVRSCEVSGQGLCGQNGLEMQLPGKTKWGRPRRRYLLDVVKEEMQDVGAREDVVFDQSLWRICSLIRKLKEEDEFAETTPRDY